MDQMGNSALAGVQTLRIVSVLLEKESRMKEELGP